MCITCGLAAAFLAACGGLIGDSPIISHNVKDIRSFATKEQNLGEGRAEPRTVYPLLYAPTTEGRRAQRGATERSEFKKYFSVIFILIGFLFFIDIIRLELIFSFYQF